MEVAEKSPNHALVTWAEFGGNAEIFYPENETTQQTFIHRMQNKGNVKYQATLHTHEDIARVMDGMRADGMTVQKVKMLHYRENLYNSKCMKH